MLYWITTISSTTLILIVEVNKNQVKPDKMTYHSITWLFYGRKLQISQKLIIMWNKLKALPNSEVSGKKLKVPRFRIVHMPD